MDKEQEKIEQLENQVKSLEFQNKELTETIKRLEDSNIYPSINIPSGSTPMTIAELVVRKCNDDEWLKAIIYYINCAINEPCFESEVDNG